MTDPAPTPHAPRGAIRFAGDAPPVTPWSWRRALRVGLVRTALVAGPPLLLAGFQRSPVLPVVLALTPLVALAAALELRVAASAPAPGAVLRSCLGLWLVAAGWLGAALVQGALLAEVARGVAPNDALHHLLELVRRRVVTVTHEPAARWLLPAAAVAFGAAPVPLAAWVRLQALRGPGDRSCRTVLLLVAAAAGAAVGSSALGVETLTFVFVASIYVTPFAGALLVAYAIVDHLEVRLDPPWRYRRPDA